MPELNDITGSTLTPDTLLTPGVSAKQTRTDELILAGTSADGISSDYNLMDAKKLATILSVRNAARELLASIDNIAKDVNDFYFKSVLSDPLATPNFTDLSRWILDNNFYIDNANAICIVNVDKGPDQAIMRLDTVAFTNPGTHYVDMIIEALPPGGTITVRNEVGVIKTLTGPSRYRFEFNVDNPAIAYLEFIVGNVEKGYTVSIESISVHYVRTSFESYMEYVAGKLLSGGSGFATTDDINLAIANLDTTLKAYVNAVLDGNLTSVLAHISDTTGNPHHITALMTNAAERIHQHALGDIAGLSGLVSDVNGNLGLMTTLQANLNSHLAANNPHGITPSIIGAAPTAHNHSTNDVSGLSEFMMSMNSFMEATQEQFVTIITEMGAGRDDASVVASMLRAHELAIGNVHGAKPSDFGIYFPTPAEAIDGTNNTTYMTPEATQLAINNRATDPGVNVNKLSPRYIGRFELTSTNLSVNIPVVAGARYQFALTGTKQHDLRKVTLTINGTATSTTTNPGVINAVNNGTTTVSETGTALRFIPSNSTYTTVFGNYDLNLDNCVLRGKGFGYQLNASFVAQGGIAHPLDISSAYSAPVQFTGADLLTIAAASMISGASIVIDMYELLPADTHPVITDALPAGMIVERFGSKPIDGYSLFDGSVLNRTNYAVLWAAVSAAGVVITKAAWDAEVATNGYCEKFHSGNGTTTFGLPKIAIAATTNRYIKLTSDRLPDPAQALYQFVWG